MGKQVTSLQDAVSLYDPPGPNTDKWGEDHQSYVNSNTTQHGAYTEYPVSYL